MKKLKLLASAAMICATPAFAADDGLIVLDWSGYEEVGFFQSYIDKHGDSPAFSFFGEEEEAFQKLRAGFKADLSHPCSQSISKWRQAGVIEPLDTSRIDRWDDVNAVKEGFKFEDGYYMLPADWGTTALTYRTDKVDASKIGSLAIFLDPEFAGRISLPDNVDDVYALAYLATGVTDWSKATEDDFKKASGWLRQAHQNVRTYWADGAELGQLMTTGEVIVAWAWNETPTTLIADGQPIASNRETAEGSSTWFCGYVNVKNSENPEDKAYDFLNAWLEPASAEYIVGEWGYGHSNTAAMTAIGTEALNEVGLGEISVPILAQIPMDERLHEMMVAEFEKIKAGF